MVELRYVALGKGMSKENSDDYLCFDFASNALNLPCNYSSRISVEKKKDKRGAGPALLHTDCRKHGGCPHAALLWGSSLPCTAVTSDPPSQLLISPGAFLLIEGEVLFSKNCGISSLALLSNQIQIRTCFNVISSFVLIYIVF